MGGTAEPAPAAHLGTNEGGTTQYAPSPLPSSGTTTKSDKTNNCHGFLTRTCQHCDSGDSPGPTPSSAKMGSTTPKSGGTGVGPDPSLHPLLTLTAPSDPPLTSSLLPNPTFPLQPSAASSLSHQQVPHYSMLVPPVPLAVTPSPSLQHLHLAQRQLWPRSWPQLQSCGTRFWGCRRRV